MEVCPSCGDLVECLMEFTGFCVACSPSDICHTCGQHFIRDQPSRTICPSCRDKLWVEKYADNIEEVMAQGKSYNEAYRIVRAQKHHCIICGVQLRKGGEFCRKKPECRKAHRRIIYLTTNKGLDKQTALEQVVNEYGGSRTTGHICEADGQGDRIPGVAA